MVAEDALETPQQELDPFDFHGRPASVIGGLGGTAPASDPDYAFHTHYVPVARGFAHFTVRFKGLQARQGTLSLRIHMLPTKPGSIARMVTSERIQFNRLVKEGGEIIVRFEAFRGANYAIMGLVTDHTDAEAEALSILLDRPDDGSHGEGPPGTIEDAQGTRFTASGMRVSPHMVSLVAPDFASPVAQPGTVGQLKAPERREWINTLGIPASEDIAGWALPFVGQAIKRYGLFHDGVAALALDPAGEPLVRALEDAGVSVRRLAIGRNDDQAASGWTPIEPRALPGAYLAHDLVWSLSNHGYLPTKVLVETIEVAMECLRPGGLAVHVVPYRRDGLQDGVSFDRNGIERLVLDLISRGHDVARVKIALDERLLLDDRSRSAFGIIARRAQSML